MKRIFSLMILFYLTGTVSVHLNAQETDTTHFGEEIAPVVTEALKKGTFTFGAGGRYRSDVDKNYDDYTTYVLEQNEKDFFIRIGLSYFIKDQNSLGIFASYADLDLSSDYITVVGDTINNKASESGIRGGVYFKNHKPLFGSKRVFFVSQAELGIGSITKNDNTLVITTDVEKASRNTSFSANLLLRMGVMVFPFPNMSIEGSIAAMGVGFKSQKFYDDGVPDGSSGDWYISFTPDFFTLGFKVTSYF
jgi:hypothetical protein